MVAAAPPAGQTTGSPQTGVTLLPAAAGGTDGSLQSLQKPTRVEFLHDVLSVAISGQDVLDYFGEIIK